MKNNYSQQKLHDYLECPRRYELKYIKQQIWPAVISEPVLVLEQKVKNGQLFHLMAQQYFTGIDQKLIMSQITHEEIRNWWISFLIFTEYLKDLPNQSEVYISGRINSYNLAGIFDLLVYIPGEKFTILDWKTNQTKPPRKLLQDHIQTKLYPLLLTNSGESWNNGEKIHPDQIEMVYWFTNSPNEPEPFQYSVQQYDEDLNFILNLISQIEKTKTDEYPLTTEEKRCKFCNYRSLCGRGQLPGIISNIDYMDVESIFQEIGDIDILQIGEIAF